MLTPLLMLGLPLLVALAIVVHRSARGDTLALVACLALALVWLRLDKRFEGPLLLAFDEDHGLVLSDLVAIVAFAVACLGWTHSRRTSELSEPQGPIAR